METKSQHDLLEIATQAVRSGIIKTLRVMAGMDAHIDDDQDSATADETGERISSVIGWRGRWTGTGMIDCTPEFACDLANHMLGTEEVLMNDDALDAMAEVTNIIFGGMKTEVEECCGALGLSIPSILRGEITTDSSEQDFTTIPIQIAEHSLKVRFKLIQAEDGAVAQIAMLPARQ